MQATLLGEMGTWLPAYKTWLPAYKRFEIYYYLFGGIIFFY